MADAPIVVEQIHEKLEEWERTCPKEDDHRVAVHAVKDIGGEPSRLH